MIKRIWFWILRKLFRKSIGFNTCNCLPNYMTEESVNFSKWRVENFKEGNEWKNE